MSAMLVPAATAGAINVCDNQVFDSNNPTHMLYGFNHTTVNNAAGKMVVDISNAPFGMVLFHDGHFPQYTEITITPPDTVDIFSRTTTGAIIIGSSFDDVLCGTVGSDWVRGRQGSDRIFGWGAGASGGHEAGTGGGAENSTFDPVTGLGGDQLFGNRGSDFVVNGFHAGPGGLSPLETFLGGGRGNDMVVTGTGADWARGGAANDVITVNGTGAHAFGNAGDDTISVPATLVLGPVTLSGNNGNDTLSLGGSAGGAAWGGKGNDTLLGGMGAGQWLFGNLGDDVLTGGSGLSHVLTGGPGNDLLTGGNTNFGGPIGTAGDLGPGHPTAADLTAGSAFFAAANGDAHQLFGTSGNNTLRANTSVAVPTSDTYGTVFMVGGAGNDTFIGGFGEDQAFGVGGNNLFNLTQVDTLRDYAWGGAGNDAYLSYCAATGVADIAREPVPPGGGVDSADRFWNANLQRNSDSASETGLFETITNSCDLIP